VEELLHGLGIDRTVLVVVIDSDVRTVGGIEELTVEVV
jgi:hypothetical protein